MLKDVLAVIVPHVDSMRESLSVLALHGLPQSSSASRLTAGASGFLNFIRSGVRPDRYRDPSLFETIPSSPILPGVTEDDITLRVLYVLVSWNREA